MGKSKRREIPKYDVGLIETHCHLDYLKEDELKVILDRSLEHHIEKIVTIAVAPTNLAKVRELTQAHEMIYGTQGIHPHEAKDVTPEVLEEIAQNINNDKIVAVGEIGLDYYYDKSPHAKQIDAFEKQLQIAVDNDKPVVIHTREADEDTIAVLKNFSSSLKKKGVIHSFTSSLDLAKFCLNEGFHLGFNGIITFNKAENVREVLRECPLERILVETDAPFLTPVPYRGKENAPFYLPFVAERIAQEKEIELDEVLRVSKQNAIDLFEL
jgi:TatD DNase family protein